MRPRHIEVNTGRKRARPVETREWPHGPEDTVAAAPGTDRAADQRQRAAAGAIPATPSATIRVYDCVSSDSMRRVPSGEIAKLSVIESS